MESEINNMSFLDDDYIFDDQKTTELHDMYNWINTITSNKSDSLEDLQKEDESDEICESSQMDLHLSCTRGVNELNHYNADIKVVRKENNVDLSTATNMRHKEDKFSDDQQFVIAIDKMVSYPSADGKRNEVGIQSTLRKENRHCKDISRGNVRINNEKRITLKHKDVVGIPPKNMKQSTNEKNRNCNEDDREEYVFYGVTNSNNGEHPIGATHKKANLNRIRFANSVAINQDTNKNYANDNITEDDEMVNDIDVMLENLIYDMEHVSDAMEPNFFKTEFSVSSTVCKFIEKCHEPKSKDYLIEMNKNISRNDDTSKCDVGKMEQTNRLNENSYNDGNIFDDEENDICSKKDSTLSDQSEKKKTGLAYKESFSSCESLTIHDISQTTTMGRKDDEFKVCASPNDENSKDIYANADGEKNSIATVDISINQSNVLKKDITSKGNVSNEITRLGGHKKFDSVEYAYNDGIGKEKHDTDETRKRNQKLKDNAPVRRLLFDSIKVTPEKTYPKMDYSGKESIPSSSGRKCSNKTYSERGIHDSNVRCSVPFENDMEKGLDYNSSNVKSNKESYMQRQVKGRSTTGKVGLEEEDSEEEQSILKKGNNRTISLDNNFILEETDIDSYFILGPPAAILRKITSPQKVYLANSKQRRDIDYNFKILYKIKDFIPMINSPFDLYVPRKFKKQLIMAMEKYGLFILPHEKSEYMFDLRATGTCMSYDNFTKMLLSTEVDKIFLMSNGHKDSNIQNFSFLDETAKNTDVNVHLDIGHSVHLRSHFENDYGIYMVKMMNLSAHLKPDIYPSHMMITRFISSYNDTNVVLCYDDKTNIFGNITLKKDTYFTTKGTTITYPLIKMYSPICHLFKNLMSMWDIDKFFTRKDIRYREAYKLFTRLDELIEKMCSSTRKDCSIWKTVDGIRIEFRAELNREVTLNELTQCTIMGLNSLLEDEISIMKISRIFFQRHLICIRDIFKKDLLRHAKNSTKNLSYEERNLYIVMLNEMGYASNNVNAKILKNSSTEINIISKIMQAYKTRLVKNMRNFNLFQDEILLFFNGKREFPLHNCHLSELQLQRY